MANYAMVYKGGKMAETDEEREQVMAAWGQWMALSASRWLTSATPSAPPRP